MAKIRMITVLIFQSNMEPTPKAANIENTAEEGDTGEVDIPQKGCGREPSEDGGPSKCSYVYGIQIRHGLLSHLFCSAGEIQSLACE